MIRINLLPGPKARKAKKQWDVELELVAGVVLVILTLGGWSYYSGLLDDEIEAARREIQEKQKQRTVLEEQVKQVQNFEAKKKLLEDKNRVIEQLEKARGGPVRAMDYISQSLEPLKLWLVKFSMKGRDLELEGKALSNDDLVEFVNNLRRSDYFTNIQLLETKSGTEAQVNIYQFRLKLSQKG
jgi:type IV pilus assembly protein PilN